MRRRALMVSAALLGVGRAAAQPERSARIGVLMPYAASDAVVQARVEAFRLALVPSARASGRSVSFEERWVGDNLDSLRAAAADLVARGVEAIVTTGSRVVPIVQRATTSIPIVFVGISDPVGQGLVGSLARPGGNTTGFSLLEITDGASPLISKLLEILSELVPDLNRVQMMFNADNPAGAFHQRTFTATALTLRLQPSLAPVRDTPQIEAAIRRFAAGLAGAQGAMLLPSDLTLLSHRALIVAAMARHHIPAIFSDSSFVEIGGLASYSADRTEMFRRSADYVLRILKGERPGELPVQQPTTYSLAVNLRTARALGLHVPAAVLARADDVFE